MLRGSAAFFCAFALTATMGMASVVDVTRQDPDSSFGTQALKRSVTVSTPNDPSLADGGLFDGTASAGMFQLNGGETLGDFAAFCIELSQGLMSSAAYVVDDVAMSARARSNVDRLFSSAYGGVDTADEAAAFQTALWEIVHDDADSFDLSAGNVRVSGSDAVVDQATTWLDGLSEAFTGAYDITFLGSSESQDLVLARLTIAQSEAAPVPVPLTGVLLLSGVGGLMAFRRLS